MIGFSESGDEMKKKNKNTENKENNSPNYENNRKKFPKNNGTIINYDYTAISRALNELSCNKNQKKKCYQN